MPRTSYDATSPYYTTPQSNWYLGPIKLRDIPPDASDVSIDSLDSRYEFRPDLLSFDLYGTPSYWWIFMCRNMDTIRDPIWDFKSGISIWIPIATRVKTLLS